MANVDAISFGVQFKRMTAGCSKHIKSKHIAPAHVLKFKQDFINKHETKMQPSLSETVQLNKFILSE